MKHWLVQKLKMPSLMPLTFASYNHLDEDQIESFDQFLYRFAKLQDTIGQRLFSGVLELLEEPAKEMPFLDKLNRLEQLKIIDSKERWLILRNLRHSLAHEYEQNSKRMCDAINHIYNSYPILIDFFVKVENFVSNGRLANSASLDTAD